MIEMRAIFLALVLAFPAAAAEYRSTGPGAGTCAQFAELMRYSPAETQLMYMSWAQGYLTALNSARLVYDMNALPVFYADSGAEIYSNVWAGVRSYCDAHPLADFEAAVLDAGGL